jgi:cell division protein FtsB
MTNTRGIFRNSSMVISLVIYALLCYFVYHVLNGERGLFSYLRLNKELQEKQSSLEKLKTERLSLEKKISLMSSRNIDYDTLDEIARANLGLMGQDEELWIIKPGKKKVGSYE